MPSANFQGGVFHDGELAVQERAGALAQGRNSGRMIADKIVPGAIKFVGKQPMVVIGSVDEQQHLWASVVVGQTGFLRAEPRLLEIDLTQTLFNAGDPVWDNLVNDARIGILVIDLRSRARLRVNGHVDLSRSQICRVTVEEAYPNCPQYIQRRNYRPAVDGEVIAPTRSTLGTALLPEQVEWLSHRDTFFVASQHPAGSVDVSHRGGNPGFVQVVSDSQLRIPDYAGNGMFNTLGNLSVDPRAGLVFPDFEHSRTLQLTGHAEILWDLDDPHNATGGTGRFWTFSIDNWLQIENALPGTSEFLDYSPHNPMHNLDHSS